MNALSRVPGPAPVFYELQGPELQCLLKVKQDLS